MARLGGNLAGLFTNNPVNAVSATGQPLIGGSQSANLLARSVGGLLGRDMRTPQEKVQQELKLVKDPTSPEGMLKQAEIFSRLGDPKSVAYAAQLAAQARTLQTAETLRTQTEKGRTARKTWLDANAPEYASLYEDYGISDEGVDSLRETMRGEEVAKKLANQGKVQKRRAFTSLISMYGKSGGISAARQAELQTKISAGDLDGVEYNDFVEQYKPEPTKANRVNVLRDVDPDDPSKGTIVEGWRENEEGNFYDPLTNTWDNGESRGFRRLAGKGKDAEIGTAEAMGSPELKGAMLRYNAAKAAGLADSLADTYTKLSEIGDVATLAAQYASSSPLTRAGLQAAGSPAGEAAAEIALAGDAITEFVGRVSSGTQIRIDEEGKFRRTLLPTAADFNNPRAIFRKLANTQIGLGITFLNAADPSSVDNEAAMSTINSMARVPITPEIEELVDTGNFREALDLRTMQLSQEFGIPLSKLAPELASQAPSMIDFENLPNSRTRVN
jgi:hypothetical protein